MSNFFDEQGHTRVCGEAYMWYVAAENPRRTLLIGKRAIYGWELDNIRMLRMAFWEISLWHGLSLVL